MMPLDRSIPTSSRLNPPKKIRFRCGRLRRCALFYDAREEDISICYTVRNVCEVYESDDRTIC